MIGTLIILFASLFLCIMWATYSIIEHIDKHHASLPSDKRQQEEYGSLPIEKQTLIRILKRVRWRRDKGNKPVL